MSIDRPIAGVARLFQHLPSRRRKQFVLVLAVTLAGAVAELVTLGAVLPFLALIADPQKAASYPGLQQLFAFLGWDDTRTILVPAMLLFALLALFTGALRLLLVWASQKFAFAASHDLGVKVYERTLNQTYSYHITRNTSELISAITKIQSINVHFVLSLIQAISGAIISAFIFAGLMIIDSKIAVIAGLGFGVMYLAVSYFSRKHLQANSVVVADGITQKIKTIEEGLGGIRDVILGQAQDVYLRVFQRIDRAVTQAQARNAFISIAPRYVIESCGMVVIAVLATLISQGPGGLVAALPTLGALALGAQRLVPLLHLVYNSWSHVAGNRQSMFDILEMLDLPVHDRTQDQAVKPLPFDHEISFNRVDFGYAAGETPVVRSVDMTIEKGSRVGLIGKTGSGKSTITDLLMGLLEPSCGTITIDGTQLTAANMPAWQNQIAHVPQSIHIADATIAENIAFAKPAQEIDWDRVKDAARLAEIAEFIETLPQGYGTLAGERGIRLSGGQRQRIGIARALYRQADVLVFDEATSALDTDTETAVMKSIEKLHHDLTIVIIAHRLSTVALCDKIIRLDGGEVVYDGPPEQALTSEPTALTRRAAG